VSRRADPVAVARADPRQANGAESGPLIGLEGAAEGVGRRDVGATETVDQTG